MFKIIFLAMILGVAAGVGAVYYQREVGELPIASADVEWESETLGTFSEPIVIAFGPPPSGDYQMDISGNLSIAGNRMPFAMDMDGTVEGRVRPDGIDMILGIGDLNAEFMDQRYSQQLDTTVTYRFDPDGRFLGADLSGLGGTASPLPMGQADEFRYLAAAFPPDGLRVGERIRFSDTQTMENYPGTPQVTVSGEAIVVERGDHQGRDALTIDLSGEIRSTTINGTFSGTSLVDIASGFVLDAEVTVTLNLPVQNRHAVVSVDMAFATDL
ncbi:MAG: hypothetical protein KDA49_17520 [Rhodospirillaceae bacterium]|nr:hypothetical protein [Rhodospirillaceae bacterium]MCA8934282.1 hypothetical protein [Rhodospirillaceae bacterium]